MKDINLRSIDFQYIVEEKEQGVLRVFESKEFPFNIQRVFTVVNALGGSRRGEHAHRKCNQLSCCVSGKVQLICNNGSETIERLLTPKSAAVLVPNGMWAEQKYLKDNSVIIVFCDQSYDEQDYIRDYDEYLEWKKEQK